MRSNGYQPLAMQLWLDDISDVDRGAPQNGRNIGPHPTLAHFAEASELEGGVCPRVCAAVYMLPCLTSNSS